jgi:hypothetical protein
MDAATKNYVIRWAMYFACASVFLVWGLVLIHLENRDQKRKQSR